MKIVDRRIVRALTIDVPRPLVCCYLIALIISYVVVATHTPLALYPGAMHDDGLFIKLGQQLAEGHWLGPFSQFTLMKGPGYPAFLAVASWLGLPVTMAHALLHCFAITVFVVVFHRFIKSYFLSGLMFALLLWHPVSLSVHLLRVFREEIYYGQVLLILATFAAALFSSHRSRQLLFAIFCGASLGWFWLTREEGVWILPALGIIIAAAAWSAIRESKTRKLFAPIAIIFSIFAFLQIGVRVGNFLAYGKFLEVDVTEVNFERALRAIGSVRSGGTKPFIPVTKAARERIYAVSPTFAMTKDYFDGPNKLGWVTYTCQFYPASCGEIAAGWFMWALRDIAAQKGYYSSPAAASAFFKKIAEEISSACLRSELECSAQFVAEMPQVSWWELAERLPPRLVTAANLLLMKTPPLQFNPSAGTEADLEPALRFLNRPLYTRSPNLSSVVTKYTLSGWYYRTGADWMSAEVVKADGSPVESHLSRNPSPDLEAGFKDPQASQQRFMLETTCEDACLLRIETPEGKKAEKSLGDIRNDASHIEVGSGAVHVDSTTLEFDPFRPTPIENLCNRLRMAIMNGYFWIFVPVLVLGALSFLAATALYWREAVRNVCYIFALASWVLVFMRVSLFILIDATSFPSLIGSYIAPAYFLLVSGAVLSCGALFTLASSRATGHRPGCTQLFSG